MAGSFTLYVLVAVPLFEEPHLVVLFGERYREYMKTTPMLLPINLLKSEEDFEKSFAMNYYSYA